MGAMKIQKTCLLVALCCTFFSTQLKTTAQAKVIDRTAATVGNTIITLSDINRFKRNLKSRKNLDPFFSLGITPGSSKQTIKFLIQEVLITKKFPASDNEIKASINDILQKNNINRTTLKKFLKKQGIRYADYRRLVGVNISKRNFIEKEIKPQARVTEDEVRNYYYTEPKYAKHRKKRTLLLSYKISQLKIPNKRLVRKVTARLKRGQSFRSVATALKNKGVEFVSLGTLREDTLSKTIKKALLGLRVGESTRPISMGIRGARQILKIDKINAPTDPVFERLKNQIYKLFYQKAIVRQIKSWTEVEMSQAFVYIPRR